MTTLGLIHHSTKPRCPGCRYADLRARITTDLLYCPNCQKSWKPEEVQRGRPQIKSGSGKIATGWYTPEFRPLRRDMFALMKLAMLIKR